MTPLRPDEMQKARIKLGELWELGREVTLGEMAHLCGLKPDNGRETILKIEEGAKPASGPITVIVRGMVDGFKPCTWDAAMKSTKASTSARGPHGLDARRGAARPTIGVPEPRRTWAGDPRRGEKDDAED